MTIAMMSMFSMGMLPLYFEGAAGMTAFAAGLILVPCWRTGATLLGGRIMDKRGRMALASGLRRHRHRLHRPRWWLPQLSVPAVFAAMLVMCTWRWAIAAPPSQTAGLRALPPRQNPFGVALTAFVQIAACIGPSLYIGIMSSGQAGAAASGASAAQATADGFARAMMVAAAIGVVGFALSLACSRRGVRPGPWNARQRSQALSVRTSIMGARPTRCRRRSRAGARGDARVRG